MAYLVPNFVNKRPIKLTRPRRLDSLLTRPLIGSLAHAHFFRLLYDFEIWSSDMGSIEYCLAKLGRLFYGHVLMTRAETSQLCQMCTLKLKWIFVKSEKDFYVPTYFLRWIECIHSPLNVAWPKKLLISKLEKTKKKLKSIHSFCSRALTLRWVLSTIGQNIYAVRYFLNKVDISECQFCGHFTSKHRCHIEMNVNASIFCPVDGSTYLTFQALGPQVVYVKSKWQRSHCLGKRS